MGLDMYLSARRYTSGGFDFRRQAEDEASKAEVKFYDKVISAAGLTRLHNSGALSEMNSLTIEVSVGYWRKHNAIHSWFVRELAGGTDECQPIYVGREDLARLRAICREILATVKRGPETSQAGIFGAYTYRPVIEIDTELAQELLEPQSGFFFGSTDYVDYYVDGLEYTADLIDILLDEKKFPPMQWDFQYQASW